MRRATGRRHGPSGGSCELLAQGWDRGRMARPAGGVKRRAPVPASRAIGYGSRPMRSHDPDEITVTPLENFPPVEQWDDWVEYDAKAWPRKVEKHYSLIPTICFNCEAACGLIAYVDKADLSIRKLEGNPHHPGSRGRNCAKGPATINQVNDPERILYPMKRVGERGSGKFERVSWDQVLDDVAGRMRKALLEGRKTEIMYHVGRPGHDGYIDRVLKAWGVD